jgi:polyisoprenoid-binding protein YceI
MFRLVVLIIFICIQIHGNAQIYSGINGELNFTSDAPLEVIKAKSENLQGALDLSKKTFAFKLYIRSFDGFNSPLQKEHFYENYLEADLFPNATFTGKIIENINEGENKVRAKGILSIHGVENEVIIIIYINKKNEIIEFKSDFKVKLDDYNIELPKIVYQKIAEIVDVHTEGTLVLRS